MLCGLAPPRQAADPHGYGTWLAAQSAAHQPGLTLAWRGSGCPDHLATLDEPLLPALLGRDRLPGPQTLYRSLACCTVESTLASYIDTMWATPPTTYRATTPPAASAADPETGPPARQPLREGGDAQVVEGYLRTGTGDDEPDLPGA